MTDWADAKRTVVASAQPAAGAGVTVGTPSSEYQQLLAVTFRLVTSAAVANRRPTVSVTDGSGVALVSVASATVSAASLTTDYSFVSGVGSSSGASGAVVTESLPALPLDAGDSIVISVAAIDAADQISRVRVTLLQEPVRDA